MKRPAVTFECPVDGCGWKVSSDEREAGAPRLRATFRPDADGRLQPDYGEYGAEARSYCERVGLDHLKTHDVLAWCRTVLRLKDEIETRDRAPRRLP